MSGTKAQGTALSDKMRALAAKGSLAPTDAQSLREQADKLDWACRGFYDNTQTVSVRRFMAVWASARKEWCRLTGEPLV